VHVFSDTNTTSESMVGPHRNGHAVRMMLTMCAALQQDLSTSLPTSAAHYTACVKMSTLRGGGFRLGQSVRRTNTTSTSSNASSSLLYPHHDTAISAQTAENLENISSSTIDDNTNTSAEPVTVISVDDFRFSAENFPDARAGGGGVVDMCGGGSIISGSLCRVCPLPSYLECTLLISRSFSMLRHSFSLLSSGIRHTFSLLLALSPCLAPSLAHSDALPHARFPLTLLSSHTLFNPSSLLPRPSPPHTPLPQRLKAWIYLRICILCSYLLSFIPPPFQGYWQWHVANFWTALPLEISFCLCPRAISASLPPSSPPQYFVTQQNDTF